MAPQSRALAICTFKSVFFLSFLIPVILFGCSNSASPNLQLTASFEGGNLYQAGSLSVLELNGTYRQMGRQYGGLMSAQIEAMYDEVIRQFSAAGMQVSAMQDFSTRLFGLYPDRYSEMALGINETSGIDRSKIALLSEFFDFLIQGSGDPSHCSGIAAWGDYTGNLPLVMGRNFDFPWFFRSFNRFVMVVVYKPSDGGRPVALITYPGQLGSIQSFNDAGLVLENNDGSSCGDANRYFGQRVPFLIEDVEWMLNAASFESLDSVLSTARLHYPLIFNVASPERAYCYEMATYEVKRREGDAPGLLIGVNHFLAPGWPAPGPEQQSAIDESALRHRNLNALANQYKGQITPERMMAILDVSLEEGGALYPLCSPGETCNIYQFVYAPSELKLWVKARAYSDWTFVDLNTLLKR